MTFLDDAVARLESEEPGSIVFGGAVPNGELPAQYRVVWANEGDEFSTRLCGTTNIIVPTFWVTSVARLGSPQNSFRGAARGSRITRQAFRDWRPYGAWKVRPEASQAPRRDESLPDSTFFAVEQFSVRINL